MADILPRFLTHPDPSIYFSDNYVCVDLETNNKDKGSALNADNRLLLSVWTSRNGVRHKFGGEYDIARLIDDIEAADFIVAHGAKFELQWLVRAGLDISNVVVFDTLLAEYVIAGNRRWKLDLDSVALRHGLEGKEQIVSLMIKLGVDPEDIDPRWLLEYCEQDVLVTERLFKIQRDILSTEGLLNVFYARCLSTPALADIEARGMALDKEAVVKEYNALAYEYAEVMRELSDFTGGINPRSPKQVAGFLYDVLGFPVPKIRGTEVRTTDKKYTAHFKATTVKQRKFLELKKKQGALNAALTKTIKPFYECVSETPDGILYAGFNQAITQTHRLSSSGKKYGVQFQNFPRKYKRLIKARTEGWMVAETDSAQLEFRTAVLMGQDEQGIKDIADRVDVHKFTASIIFREEFAECGGDMKSEIGARIRQDSKSHTFKPLYGGQSGSEREMEYYAAFRDKYAGIAAMQETWKQAVLKHKQLRTITGLIFYWPDTELTKSGYITNSTNICNYPVQMFATADIMPIAVRFLWQYLRMHGMRAFLTNTVHDSAIGEVPPDEREQYERLATKAFNEDSAEFMRRLYGIDMNVPLESEHKLGAHWGT